MELGAEHPLSLELESLRSAGTRWQQEAHSASLQLQRYALDNTGITAKLSTLESTNAVLQQELSILRATPARIVPSPHSAELTLALRRSSDQLSITETTLLARTAAVQQIQSQFARAKFDAEQAWFEAQRERELREQSTQREAELTRQLRASEENVRLSDKVVQEYADLVRMLDGKPQSSRQLDSLAEGKAGLARLVAEFSQSASALEAQLADAHSDLAKSEATLITERKGADDDRFRLAEALTELEKVRTDDNSASRIVSRYMKFSQSTTDALQKAIESQIARHTATVESLSLQNATLAAQLAGSRTQTDILRVALDELGADAAREAFARRREVALRLEVVGREERLKQQLARLLNRLKEQHNPLAEEFNALMEATEGGRDGSLGRIIAAEHAAVMFQGELRHEIERRLAAERRVTELEVEREEVWVEREIMAEEPERPHPVADTTPSVPLFVDPIEIPTTEEVSSQVILVTPETLYQPSPRTPGDTSFILETVVAEKNLSLPGTPEEVPDSTPPSSLFVNGATTPKPKQTPLSPLESTEPLPSISFTSQESEKLVLDDVRSSLDAHTEAESSGPLAAPNKTSALLEELNKVKSRYDDLQRSFRGCHLALQDLKASLSSATASNSSVLRTAVERLSDFSEDARVELEIRTADETLAARGYSTVLTLSPLEEKAEAERDVRAFLGATSARSALAAKLEDLHHDIAALKRAVHEVDDQEFTLPPPASPKWSGWTGILSGGSGGGSGSPSRNPSPVPTFGNVMTTPRLRETIFERSRFFV